MLIVTGIVLVALLNASDTNTRVGRLATSTTQALCTLRADVEKRVASGNAFLKAHPHGFAGISGPALRVSINNSERTALALSSLVCPR